MLLVELGGLVVELDEDDEPQPFFLALSDFLSRLVDEALWPSSAALRAPVVLVVSLGEVVAPGVPG